MTKIGQKVRGSATGRPIMALFDILGQRWTLRILWELNSGPQTFRALRSRCDEVSPTSLNKRLKTLRELGLIEHDESGYGLSELGLELASHLDVLNAWSNHWAKKIKAPNKASGKSAA